MDGGMSTQDIEHDLKQMLWNKNTTPNRSDSSASKQQKKRRGQRKGRNQPDGKMQPSPQTPSQVESPNKNFTPKKQLYKEGANMSRGNGAATTVNEERPEVYAELEKEHIYHLRKKSAKFPTAAFYCRLCEYHCDNVAVCYRHFKDTRHKKLKSKRHTDLLLRYIPAPTLNHCQAATVVLESVLQDQQCILEMLLTRRNVIFPLQSMFEKKFPGIDVHTYGSTQTGFTLQTSDINIDISKVPSMKALLQIHKLLLEDTSGEYTNIYTDFQAKVPTIHFKLASLDVACTLSCNNTTACMTSSLMALYANMHPLVVKLGVLFRYWAKMVKVDKQQVGCLPAYVFPLMVIYYLQQQDLLPVLHEAGEKNKHGGGIKNNNSYLDDVDQIVRIKQKYVARLQSMTLGELFIGLLRFYAATFDMHHFVISIRQYKRMPRDEKKWGGNKKLYIEDPFSTKRNVARSLSHSEVFEYVYDRLRAAYLYYAIPQTEKGPLYSPEMNDEKLANRLQQTMRQYDILSGGGAENPRTDEGKVKQKRHSSVTKYCNKFTDKTDGVGSKSDTNTCDSEPPGEIADTDGVSDLVDQLTDTVISSVTGSVSDDSIPKSETDEESVLKNGVEDSESASSERLSEDEEYPDQSEEEDGARAIVEDLSPGSDLFNKSMADDLAMDEMTFEFTKEILVGKAKGPARICSLCQKEGHLKQNCPDEVLPPLEPLPPMAPEYICHLSDAIKKIPNDFEPTSDEESSRQLLLFELESYIKEKFHQGANLSLFGSSVNGFGFQYSDLDICMTLEGEDPEKVDSVDTIKRLARSLQMHRSLYSVIPITTAKVPIVKFCHRPSRLDGDISLYNTLAQHNTAMLFMYSSIDRRVKELGYTMKVFAKMCDMCDASRGSLSSYAYILMVLYFLQQRDPPVIPVLQELHNGEKPVTTVDGWNAWFFDDLKELPKRWPQFGQNKESVAELWLGLLRFYTEEFNVNEHVISIRQHEKLTRFEKLWNGKCIAIEDPFDLNHNLGGGLSRRMNMYIMKAFRNGRALVGTPIHGLTNEDLANYLFDPARLTMNTPLPNDRGCRVCSKIGHFAKECPVVLARKERKENAKLAKDHSFDSRDVNSPRKEKTPVKGRNRREQRGTPQHPATAKHSGDSISESPDARDQYSRHNRDSQYERDSPQKRQEKQHTPGKHTHKARSQQQNKVFEKREFVNSALSDEMNLTRSSSVTGDMRPTGEYKPSSVKTRLFSEPSTSSAQDYRPESSDYSIGEKKRNSTKSSWLVMPQAPGLSSAESDSEDSDMDTRLSAGAKSYTRKQQQDGRKKQKDTPWMTQELHELLMYKGSLLKETKRPNVSQETVAEFKRVKKEVNLLVRQAKREWFNPNK